MPRKVKVGERVQFCTMIVTQVGFESPENIGRGLAARVPDMGTGLEAPLAKRVGPVLRADEPRLEHGWNSDSG